MYSSFLYFFFFFQAEDGIRDLYVTGVQTCALPLSAQANALVDAFFTPDQQGRWAFEHEHFPQAAAHFVDPYWKGDRKSTRLNSSHVEISYAVFCLKKKK